MIYHLDTTLDRERLKKRMTALFTARKVVEVTEVKPRRSNAQNRYLHLILGEFAMQTGNTLDYVKQNYFKRLCNAETFVIRKSDIYAGTVELLRSSADLTSAGLSTAIERFRNWASSEAGIYLPAPNDYDWLDEVEREMQYQREHL